MDRIQLKEGPREGCRRSRGGIMGTLPRRALLEKSQTTECPLNGGETHMDSLLHEFMVDMLATPPSTLAFLENRTNHRSRQCGGTVLGTRRSCRKFTPSCGHGESAPPRDGRWGNPEPLGHVPHGPVPILHQLDRISSDFAHVGVCGVWHIPSVYRLSVAKVMIHYVALTKACFLVVWSTDL
jgi:hypothetical protein